MLAFKSVSHVYNDKTLAVDDVSLQVQKGEFCVLLGPSGAGKSTLMNMVNCVVIPSSGKIMIGDIELNNKNRKLIQRRVGMIHQQLHLVPRLSVIHNVLSGILPQINFWKSLFKIFPISEQRRACQLLASVGLEEAHLYKRASELSGGQQQRVAIARAFMSQPEVVLADEPVASLDPVMSRSVLTTLKNAAKEHNATVVCTLHQMEYALEFADRIIALRKGKVFFDGHPKNMDQATQTELYKISNAQDSVELKAVNNRDVA